MVGSELEKDPNVVPSRFVLAIKHEDSGDDFYTALFLLGGHKDRAKPLVVHSAKNLKQSSVRVLLALANILGFSLWSTDINQAYLQSAFNLTRRIFVRPDNLELDKDTLLQVVKPLYGLSDAGDYWGEALIGNHKKELKMSQAEGDSSLFFERIGDRLTGLSGTYVDDILRAGTKSFRMDVSKATSKAFDSKPAQKVPFTFTGMNIHKQKRMILLSQQKYIEMLELLPTGVSFEKFRSMRAKLASVVNSRPDIACAISFASQVTERIFDGYSYKLLNRINKYFRSTKEVCLKFPKLDPDSLQLTVYSDSSFKIRQESTARLVT